MEIIEIIKEIENRIEDNKDKSGYKKFIEFLNKNINEVFSINDIYDNTGIEFIKLIELIEEFKRRKYIHETRIANLEKYEMLHIVEKNIIKKLKE